MSCWVILGRGFWIGDIGLLFGGRLASTRGFSAFHERQTGDQVKAGGVIVQVLGGDWGLT